MRRTRSARGGLGRAHIVASVGAVDDAVGRERRARQQEQADEDRGDTESPPIRFASEVGACH